MARDKSKDNVYFHCSNPLEMKYVSSLYKRKNDVLDFLIKNCQDGTINYFTYIDVYKMIHKYLGFPIPE